MSALSDNAVATSIPSEFFRFPANASSVPDANSEKSNYNRLGVSRNRLASLTEQTFVYRFPSNEQSISNAWDTLVSQIEQLTHAGFQNEPSNSADPSPDSLRNTLMAGKELVEAGLQVLRVEKSAEGGICLVFRKGSQNLYLEFYNDGDVGYIVEDFHTKQIIDNRDIRIIDSLGVVSNFFQRSDAVPH